MSMGEFIMRGYLIGGVYTFLSPDALLASERSENRSWLPLPLPGPTIETLLIYILFKRLISFLSHNQLQSELSSP